MHVPCYWAKKQAAIRALVGKSVPLAGTPAETYLRQERGLTGPFPQSLRYIKSGRVFTYPDSQGVLQEKKIPFGAMLSLATTPEGVLKAVQVTYLDVTGHRGRDAAGNKLPKLTFGAPKGAFVDLSRSDQRAAPPHTVFLAEGVETALSVQKAGAPRVMASLGLTNLKNFETSAEKVIVCADQDGDPTLPQALTHAVKAFKAKGRSVTVLLPGDALRDKIDFNDLLQKGGVKSVRARLESVVLPANLAPIPSEIQDHVHDLSSRLSSPEAQKDHERLQAKEKAAARQSPTPSCQPSPPVSVPENSAQKETPPSGGLKAHEQDAPPLALDAYLKAAHTLQALKNTRPHSYACAQAMTACEIAEKALVACEKSRQGLEASDPPTYHRLVQAHGDIALKTQVFDTAFAAAQQGDCAPTDLMRSLEAARHQESLALQEGRPYGINKAQVTRMKAEEAASKCPHTMAHLSHQDPQTFEKLTQKRQQDLQRDQQRDRGRGLGL